MSNELLIASDLKQAQREAYAIIGSEIDYDFLAEIGKNFHEPYKMTVQELGEAVETLLGYHGKVYSALLAKIEQGKFPHLDRDALKQLLPAELSHTDEMTALKSAIRFAYRKSSRADPYISLQADKKSAWLHPASSTEVLISDEIQEDTIRQVLAGTNQELKVYLADLVWNRTHVYHKNPDISLLTALEIQQGIPAMRAVILREVELALDKGVVPKIKAHEVISEAGMSPLLGHIKSEEGMSRAITILQSAFPVNADKCFLFLDYHAGRDYDLDDLIGVHTPVSYEPRNKTDNSIAARLHRALEVQSSEREATRAKLTGTDFLDLLPEEVAQFLKHVEETLIYRIEASKLPIVEVPLSLAPCEATGWVTSPGMEDVLGHPLMLMDVAEIYFEKQHRIQANCNQDYDRNVVTFSF